MDRFGRKRTIQIGAVIATVGGILQAAAMNLAMILVGRIISGWAIGLMSMSVPVYLAECAHPNTRGMIVGITQQMIGVGFIVSTWVGYGSRHTSDASSFQWRFPLAFQIIPSAFLVIGLIWLPESPRYLIEKDRDDVGLKTLRKLHYNGSNDEWIQNEYNEIRATISAEKAITAPGWAVMFKVPQWRKRLLLGTLIQVFTQLTGISKLITIHFHQRIALTILSQMLSATTKPSCTTLWESQATAHYWSQESTTASDPSLTCSSSSSSWTEWDAKSLFSLVLCALPLLFSQRLD